MTGTCDSWGPTGAGQNCTQQPSYRIFTEKQTDSTRYYRMTNQLNVCPTWRGVQVKQLEWRRQSMESWGLQYLGISRVSRALTPSFHDEYCLPRGDVLRRARTRESEERDSCDR
ncbi:hypothetical protein RRG08_030773 [Elysia crispata]|uniref:Uncharacterized protein n=1 Tax=Elysia crispata TaxID=231223 RepID=A0AAE0YF78_9GAST|nr:hypothetical protein RRG08_030773 [Elysia crispata]